MNRTDQQDSQLTLTAAILPGCSSAPDVPICGLSRRERLRHMLMQRGYRIINDAKEANFTIADCRILIGDEEHHVCTEGLRAIEDRLLESLRKPIDGFVARFINRRISLAITRRLMNTRISPNHISVVTLLLGIACGVVVAQGTYWTGVLGALLFQMQSILDGVDGELARLRFQGSHLGQWLDTVSDDLSNLSFLIGMTLIAPSMLRWLGVWGIVAFVVTQGIIYYALVTRYRSGDLLAFRWDLGKPNTWLTQLKYLVKHDVFCLSAVILALLGLMNVILVLASLGAIIVSVTLFRQLACWGLTPPEPLAQGESLETL